MLDCHIHHLHHVPHARIISAILLVKILVVAQFHPALRYHPSPQTLKTPLLRVGLVVLSWLISLGKCVWSFIQEKREDRAAMEYFAYRVRKARENGEGTVSTEGL